MLPMEAQSCSNGIEKLEVGYWNVSSSSSSTWYGIEKKMKDVIKAMKAENCDILFCSDTRRPTVQDGFSGSVLNKGQGYGEYEFEDERYVLYWLGEINPDYARKIPGGVCVIWKKSWENKIPEGIQVDVVSVREKPSQEEGALGGSEITKHRIFTVELNTALGKIVIISCFGIANTVDNVYDSDEQKKVKNLKDKDAETFFLELKRVVEKVKTTGEDRKLIVLLGDMGAQIPLRKATNLKDKIKWAGSVNIFHDFSQRHKRGEQFLEFCENQQLTIASVLFPSSCPTFRMNYDDAGSYIDHFAIGWVEPSENDVTEDRKTKKKTLKMNGDSVVQFIRVARKLPNASENFNSLCVASLDCTKPAEVPTSTEDESVKTSSQQPKASDPANCQPDELETPEQGAQASEIPPNEESQSNNSGGHQTGTLDPKSKDENPSDFSELQTGAPGTAIETPKTPVAAVQPAKPADFKKQQKKVPNLV